MTRNDSWPSMCCSQPHAAERHSLVHNALINKLQAVTTQLMETEFYHFECLKSLRNTPELQLQDYCNILKKLEEEFVVHRFRDFIHMTAVSIYFLTQCRLIYGTTLIPGDLYISSSTCTCSSVPAGRWLKVTNQFSSPLILSALAHTILRVQPPCFPLLSKACKTHFQYEQEDPLRS